MITKTIQLYKFNELSDDIQNHVIEHYRDTDSDFWEGEEIVATLKAFCDHFSIDLVDFELGGFYDYVEINHDRLPEKEALRVTKKWINTCPLTGVCYDINILLPLLNYKGLEAEDILKNCFDELQSTYHSQLDHWYSKKYIRDEIEANEYTFRENGTMENI